jgi:hypothetical protein
MCGLILFATLAILLASVGTPYAAKGRLIVPRWPRGVDPEKTPPQIMNPEYLKKQETLQQAELQLHRQERLQRQFQIWTRSGTFTKNQNNYRTWQKIHALKKQLRETPKYITAPDQPDKPVKE